MEGMLGVLAEAGLSVGAVDVIIHGTTLATNAIIERKGSRTALIATEGFRDTLDIADEGRYDQYDIEIEKPRPLVPRARRFTVPERMDVEGRVRRPLDEAAVTALVPRLQAAGIESVAVALMHSYANPAHERQHRRAPARVDARPVAHARAPSAAPRSASTSAPRRPCANAYVQPLMAGYIERLEALLDKARVHRRALPDDLGRRPRRRRRGAALPGAAHRVGAGGRRHPGRRGGRAVRRAQGAELRHGRDHRQDLPHRGLPPARLPQLRGGPRGALPQGLGIAAPHSRDRDGGDRRRRRLDRAGRRARAHHRGAGQRRRRARPRVLRARRHRADGDRRRYRIGPHRSRSASRAAGCPLDLDQARRALDSGGGQAARPSDRDGARSASRRSSTRRWRTRRGSTRSSAAR